MVCVDRCCSNFSKSSVHEGKTVPLIQGGLEIEIEVFVEWEKNDKNLKILEEKVKSVNFPSGEPYKQPVF